MKTTQRETWDAKISITSFSSVPGRGSPSRSQGWWLIDSFHFPLISIFVLLQHYIHIHPLRIDQPCKLAASSIPGVQHGWYKEHKQGRRSTKKDQKKLLQYYIHTVTRISRTWRKQSSEWRKDGFGLQIKKGACTWIKKVICNKKKSWSHNRTRHRVESIAQLYSQLLSLSWPSPLVNQSRYVQL